MELLYILKLLGAFMVIYGAISLIRRQAIMPAINEMGRSRGLLLLFATLELAAGLAIVIAFPSLSVSWAGAVSLIGWLMVLEGILYLAFPKRLMQPIMLWVNKPTWYMVGGICAIAVGIAMLAVGFGWW